MEKEACRHGYLCSGSTTWNHLNGISPKAMNREGCGLLQAATTRLSAGCLWCTHGFSGGHSRSTPQAPNSKPLRTMSRIMGFTRPKIAPNRASPAQEFVLAVQCQSQDSVFFVFSLAVWPVVWCPLTRLMLVEGPWLLLRCACTQDWCTYLSDASLQVAYAPWPLYLHLSGALGTRAPL